MEKPTFGPISTQRSEACVMASFPGSSQQCARAARILLLAAAATAALAAGSAAEPAGSDRIGDLLRRPRTPLEVAQGAPADVNGANASAKEPRAGALRDPREGDAQYEQAQKLMKAVNAILDDAARDRSEAKKLPSENEFIMKPLWTETREDREKKVRDLLNAALGIVTDVPVVDMQKKIEGLRKSIRE